MARKTIVRRNTRMSVAEEITPNVAVPETAEGAFVFTVDNGEFNLDKELLESNEIIASLSKTAPQAGMDSEDMGYQVGFNIRVQETKPAPEWGLFMKSIMGSQEANTDNAIAAAPSPTTTQATTNVPNDLTVGQLLKINDEIVRLENKVGDALTWFPPLIATPIALDDIFAGVNWKLTSEDHPTFTTYVYLEELSLRYTGCQTVNCELVFEVGQRALMNFTVKALKNIKGRDIQAVTPQYDIINDPMICTGITAKTLFSAIAKDIPTTTETTIASPRFLTRVGDYLIIDVGGGVFETVQITDVVGYEGEDQVLTHDPVSVAATPDDTVYILNQACGNIQESLTLTIATPDLAHKCMIAESGFSGRTLVDRVITMTNSVFLDSWQEFLLRDDVIGSVLQVTLQDKRNNAFCVHIPSRIISEASLTGDDLMMVDLTSQAVRDSVLGNDNEMIIGAFKA